MNSHGILLLLQVKDYISFPKPNGYQSLHTALMLNGQAIEVQIRTSAMHQVAEYGMASHWVYTDGKRRKMDSFYNTPWLSSIKEWQDDSINSRDFVDSVRRELLGKRVFVFLRNGKILNLARGATAIDAAFQIHTEVGLTMQGVEINGKPVSEIWSKNVKFLPITQYPSVICYPGPFLVRVAQWRCCFYPDG